MANMAGSNDTPFALEKPPVKRVELSLAFAASPAIQGWHLAAFFTGLRERYLSVTETAPLPSGSGETGYEFLPDDGTWPIARTEFVGADRSLAVQGDRLDVVWEFGDGDDEHAYIGFESLINEMDGVYSELLSALLSNGVEIEPSSAQCYYINEIDEVAGAELAVGVLTGWGAVPASAVPTPGYVGVRLHGCRSTDHKCSSWVMVDSQDEEPPTLSIRVKRPITDGDKSAMHALREAHDELIGLFRRYTSDELRRGWGE